VTTTTAADPRTTAALFHALSDPIRLQVIELLRGGERCVCELTEELGIQQSRLSWHLRTLREAGFLTDRREGRWIYYALALDPFAEASAYLADVTESLERTSSRRSLPVRGQC
jgi:ArsR family transcriptional regulator, arsenate/arsenite/antimonite-responsive transcriptional repressor